DVAVISRPALGAILANISQKDSVPLSLGLHGALATSQPRVFCRRDARHESLGRLRAPSCLTAAPEDSRAIGSRMRLPVSYLAGQLPGVGGNTRCVARRECGVTATGGPRSPTAALR